MKKTILLTFIIGLFLASEVSAQAPGDTLWTRTYGGISDDASYSIEQTTDGGFIIAGKTYSFGAGDEDAYLIKTDVSGDTLWTRTYGGINSDFAKSVKQTNDGGYIFVGATYSFGAAVEDAWLVKTDANGNTLWMQTYGGNYWDNGCSVQQTDDGGYIFAGSTTYNWQNDIYLVRTDAVGDTLWTKTFGGGQNDYGREIQKTSDGSYIIVGKIFSVESNSYDVYLLKIDDNGNTIWEHTYGGSNRDEGWSVKQTSDNGFIIAGSTKSFSAGEEDMYLIKADVDGNELWSHSYGGSLYDVCNYVDQTIDGGYILLGGTTSFGAGSYDVYLVKVNFNGDTLWTRTYGSDGQEEGWALLQDNYDDNYLVTGKTFSFGAGGSDVWLLKVTYDAAPAPGSISGTVSLNGGTGNVNDVLITAEPGNYQTNPIGTNYTLTVYEGDYCVTAALDGYFPQIFENVHVDPDQTTIVDFDLNPVAVVVTPSDFYFTTNGVTNDVLNLENQNDIDIDYQISINFESETELNYDGPNAGTLGTGPPELSWAVRFTSDELSDYYDNGYEITHIKCFFYEFPGENTVFKVWEGGSFGDPGTEVYSATGTDLISGDWMIHELSNPISLVEGNEYWVGCVLNSIPPDNSPFGVDAGPMVSGKGGWLYYMGAWYQLTDLGVDFNWNLRAIISNPWLACDPISGVIPSNGNIDIDVMIDATELDFGDYYADIIVDILPDLATYIIPVHLLKMHDTFTLNIKVFLEGTFNGTDMNTHLNPADLPLTHPYGGPPWNYSGAENVASIPNVNIVDWVLVELRDATEAQYAYGSTMIARQAAFILNDGSIVGLDGISFLTFNVSIEDDLFAVVWHRNHLGVLSANALTGLGNVYAYNFKTGADKAYGGASGHKEIGTGIWGMIASDGNADGYVNLLDKDDIWTQQAGEKAYKYGDYNLNGQVNNQDKDDIWLPNYGDVSQVPE